MLVTRVGYVLIIGVMAVAMAAAAIVLRPDSATEPSALEFKQVIDYSKVGVIERIELKGQTLTVHFRPDFDTNAQFGSDGRVFQSVLPAGEDLVSALQTAGVPVNEAGGPQVISR